MALFETNTKQPISLSSASRAKIVCGAETNNGGHCKRPTTDSERCYLHDESGVADTHGAPDGNQNAVGNNGGGVPLGSANAMTYGVYASRDRLWSEMSDTERERFVQIQNAVTSRFGLGPHPIAEDITWQFYRRLLTDRDVSNRDFVLENGRPNPSLHRGRLFSSRTMDLLARLARVE